MLVGSENENPVIHLFEPDPAFKPDWIWFSEKRKVPERLASALEPRKCCVVSALNPAEYLLEARKRPVGLGEILVIDGSEGQAEMIQLWLRHLRRDARTSAAPILVWSHSGRMSEFDTQREFFRLSPDGVIGRRGWKGGSRWIERVESILNFRQRRQFHIDVHLDMASRPEALERTAAWILECAALVPWMKSRKAKLRQAIFELGQNAIEWGNNGDATKTVHIRLRSDERCLHLSVTDQGKGFNPQQLPHAAAEEDPIRHLEVREQLGLREGGFGILITRGLVDKMSYNASGNAVRVTLRHQGLPEDQARG
jgi:anti-sigma regulatory factor (Ser/Thr protein kinase)